MSATFHAVGFEELFVRHRSDQNPAPRTLGSVEDAVAFFATEFEESPNVHRGSEPALAPSPAADLASAAL